MKYRLFPFSFGIKLQDNYEAWKLAKFELGGVWTVVEAPNPAHIDPNENNIKNNLPPMYYTVKRGEDVMVEIKKIFPTAKVISKNTADITFED